jgi:hypothetical protein
VRADLVNVAAARPLTLVLGQLGIAYDGDVLYLRLTDSGKPFGGLVAIDHAALERSRFRVARKLRARVEGWPEVPVDMSPAKTRNRSPGKRRVTSAPTDR